MPRLSGEVDAHQAELRVFKARLRDAVIDAQDAANCRARWEALRRGQRAYEGAMAAAYSAMSADPLSQNLDTEVGSWRPSMALRRMRAEFGQRCLRTW